MKKSVLATGLTVPALILAWLSASALIPDRLAHASLWVERTLAGLQQDQVEIGGHRINYLHGGKGETVLLLHGFAADAYHWTRFARPLAGDYRVIVPDLPGFGASSRKANGDYSIRAQAERVGELIRWLDTGPVHLAGNSMGGLISAVVALEQPHLVRSLTLIDNAGITTPDDTIFIQGLREGRNSLLVSAPGDLERVMSLVFVDPPWFPAPLFDYLERRAIADHALHERIFAQILDKPFALESRMAKLRMPVLIMWGKSDQVLSVSAVEIMRRLKPDSETFVLDDTGHLPMLERPRETSARYRIFIEAASAEAASNETR